MKTIKRTSILIIVSIFIFITVCNPVIGGLFVFADSNTDNWQNVTTTEEMAEAFRYYCKSRNLTIDTGPNSINALDIITKFTTKSFRSACHTLGIDMDGLQAHIKYDTDNLGNIRFLFDATGISAYNRIFAEFLQNNELEVGDTVNNTLVYGGLYYKDVSGNSCLCYETNQNPAWNNQGISAIGTPYLKTSEQMVAEIVANNNATQHYSYQERNSATNTGTFTTYTYNLNYGKKSGYYVKQVSNNTSIPDAPTQIYGVNVLISGNYRDSDWTGNMIVLHKASGDTADRYCLAVGNYATDGTNYYCQGSFRYYPKSDNIEPANIYFTTNNNTINNNYYEGDTIINNDGTPSTPSTPEPEPDPKPDPDDEWDIELPDLDVNWILTGKENKFPFNIPFNIMFALSLLNAEPEAPHFQGTISLGIVQWNYDIDLSPYNSVAVLCRNLEFLLFIIGLMFATRQLIWG